MSKRKKHNPVKRLVTQSRIAVSDLALVMTFADELVECVKAKTGKPVGIGNSVAQALNQTGFKWFILLAVYCLESNGKRKLVTKPLQMTACYRHDQLTKYLRESHQNMQDECEKHNHVVNAGWTAVPVPYDAEAMEADLVRLLDDERHWQYRQAA